jgi:hypothetical protein
MSSWHDWRTQFKQGRCRIAFVVSHVHRQTQMFSAEKSKAVLCLHLCFRIYHTKIHFWNMGVITLWGRNHLKKCWCCACHYNILFYFRKLKTFFRKDNFYQKRNNTTIQQLYFLSVQCDECKCYSCTHIALQVGLIKSPTLKLEACPLHIGNK